ncbi:hypothetical protein J2S43_007177 [Catenuloplanes nepalensis]|uniref:Uncharacterized protein n=1 Tax=Catenuloplanes nepalensis TaxID=587533 RepID=A0ABT9N4M9_9ACTN|nr:hypothetical protein [Catenuloplanes nepalensis]MDP9798665.1 hypothetical protein [Catenuloplanes nepalensis]
MQLIVREVGADLRRFPSMEWVTIVGTELVDGAARGEVTVIARVLALPAAVRPAG